MSGLGGMGHVVTCPKLSILHMEKLRPKKVTHLKSCPQQPKETLYPKGLLLYFSPSSSFYLETGVVRTWAGPEFVLVHWILRHLLPLSGP